MKKISLIALSLSFLGLAACSLKNHDHNRSIVKLESKSGSKVKGTLYLEDHYGGVIISGKVSGLTPGKHGIHIHENGNCTEKDGSSAGGHFHVGNQVHGAHGAPDSHSGDLGNIEVGKNGKAEINIYAKDLTLGSGSNSIAKRSIIIHKDSDDFKTQPSGNSGARVACGVIEVKACDGCGDCDQGCSKGCDEGKGEKAKKKSK